MAKKVGDEWKKKMLKPPPPTVLEYTVPYQRAEQQEFSFQDLELFVPSRFEKLVAELLAANKTDEQILEAVTLAAASRLPTAEEKRATLVVIATAADKKAAWIKLAEALASEASGKARPRAK